MRGFYVSIDKYVIIVYTCINLNNLKNKDI